MHLTTFCEIQIEMSLFVDVLPRFNQQSTSILDEEGSVYVDQLKEYLFFTDSLR